MGCCNSCSATNPNAHNPAMLEEIAMNISNGINKQNNIEKKERTFLLDLKPGNTLQKQNTKPIEESNAIPNIKEEEKKMEKEELTPAKVEISIKENNKDSFENSPLTENKQRSNEDNKASSTEQAEGPNTSIIYNSEKPKSLINKVSFGPEIFVQMKTQNICENYTMGQFLGKGSFGQVRLVTHKSTGLIRAMKIIKKSSLIRENEEKFFAELFILKNLDHPNIVRLLELFQDVDNYYLITEYCSGGELFERVKKLKFLTEFHAANIMKQILQAVVYCHSQNIVHRDLKPENIVFESTKSDSLLKIIDFGTSRKFDPKEKMTKTLGTAFYIAPEVLNQDYTEKCDVWSCGVILYILLCGYPPFSGKSQEEIFYRVKLGKFEFREQDWAGISEDAKSLIRQMLRYDQTKRISAEEALNSKWLKKNARTNIISNKAIHNLVRFHATNQIQAAIYTFIISHLTPPQEKDDLQKCFENLDKNGDGKLCQDELIEAYTTIYGNNAEARYLVARVIKETDSNSSGKIDYTEFLVAATKREKLLAKNKVEQAFKLFDTDGNGFITKDELVQLMGDSIVNDEMWKEILDKFDTNRDGKISQTEFLNILTEKYDKE